MPTVNKLVVVTTTSYPRADRTRESTPSAPEISRMERTRIVTNGPRRLGSARPMAMSVGIITTAGTNIVNRTSRDVRIALASRRASSAGSRVTTGEGETFGIC